MTINISFNTDIDAKAYCDKAKDLYGKFCNRCIAELVAVVIDYHLSCMQKNNIGLYSSVLYHKVASFIPEDIFGGLWVLCLF